MKLAVFGNSHVGMLRAASSHPDFADCEFAWMARHTPGTLNFEVVEGKVVDTTSGRLHAPGMETELNLNDFDGAIIAGNTIRVNDVARLSRSFFVPAWMEPKRAKSLLAERAKTGPPLYPMTEAALRASLMATLTKNRTYAWLTALQGSLAVPCYVVPPVFACEAVLSPETVKHDAFRAIADYGTFDQLAATFNAVHMEAFRAFERVSVVLQDDATVAHGFFTRETFSRGATSLDPTKKYPENDMLHGNAEMGRLVLSKILRDFS